MRQILAVSCILALLVGVSGVLDAQIVMKKAPTRPTLGVTVEEGSGPGVGVVGVEAGAAARAGVKVGDRILRFGGQEINSIRDLQAVLSRLSPGSEAKMVLKRGSKTGITTRVSFPGGRARGGSGTGPRRGIAVVPAPPPGPRGLPGGSGNALREAETSIRKAMDLLEDAGAQGKKANKMLKRALKSVAKARARSERARRPAPTPRAQGGFFGNRLGEMVEEMLADGASRKEIEEAIREEFGNNVKVKIQSGRDGEEIEEIEEDEVEEVEEVEAEVSPKVRKSRKSSSRRSIMISPTSRRSAASEKEMKEFLKKMRGKKAAESRKSSKK